MTKTATRRDVDELRAAILDAHERGDTATLERLQDEYRSGGYLVQRVMGPGSIQLVDRGQRSHAREAPARSSPAAPEVTGSAGITVVVTVGADEAIRSFLDQELEVCGGLYGHTINGEIVVEQATLIRRDSHCRNRHRDKEQHMTDKPDPDALHIAIESFLGQLDDGQPIVVAKGSKWKGEFVRRYSTFFVDAATADEPEIARKRAALQQ